VAGAQPAAKSALTIAIWPLTMPRKSALTMPRNQRSRCREIGAHDAAKYAPRGWIKPSASFLTLLLMTHPRSSASSTRFATGDDAPSEPANQEVLGKQVFMRLLAVAGRPAAGASRGD